MSKRIKETIPVTTTVKIRLKELGDLRGIRPSEAINAGYELLLGMESDEEELVKDIEKLQNEMDIKVDKLAEIKQLKMERQQVEEAEGTALERAFTEAMNTLVPGYLGRMTENGREAEPVLEIGENKIIEIALKYDVDPATLKEEIEKESRKKALEDEESSRIRIVPFHPVDKTNPTNKSVYV